MTPAISDQVSTETDENGLSILRPCNSARYECLNAIVFLNHKPYTSTNSVNKLGDEELVLWILDNVSTRSRGSKYQWQPGCPLCCRSRWVL